MPDHIKLNTSKMVDILRRNKTTVMQVNACYICDTCIGYAGFPLLGEGMWHDYVSELFVLLELRSQLVHNEQEVEPIINKCYCYS